MITQWKTALGVIGLTLVLVLTHSGSLLAQVEVPEVRQLVTFRFQPGMSGKGMAIFRDQAVPLYRENEAMLRFRGFTEVESPEPLDLIVVSSFRGMAGMDESNGLLTEAAARLGTSVGQVYGAISAVSVEHHDQFVEMLEPLVNGIPEERRLLVLISYQVSPGGSRDFERAIGSILPWERGEGIPSVTGRFLVSEGWHYLRFVGFDSLGDFHAYRTGLRGLPEHGLVDALTLRTKEIVVARIAALDVR